MSTNYREDDYSFTIKMPDTSRFESQVKSLADRLGVKPVANGPLGEMRICLVAGGESYDVFDLANAFLDQINNSKT